MTNEEFKIDSMPERQFRIGKMTPIEVLAISTQINFENFKMTETLITFAVEHTEVKIGEKWMPVKVKDKEIYQPTEISKNLPALNEIFSFVMEKLVAEVFPNSVESK